MGSQGRCKRSENRNLKGASAARLLATTAIVGLCLCVLHSLPAMAQTTVAEAGSVRTFDIPAQSLASALNAFGRQSGLQVTLAASTTHGVRSHPVNGRLTPQQALAAMLQGTGIPFRITPDRTAFVGQQVSVGGGAIAANGSTMLDTIDVQGGKGGFSEDTPYETAGSSTYISQEKIERFRGTSVGDMLSGTPGVLNADNRNGAALDVNIRGMQGQGRVPIIVNGAQQETTVYRGYAGIAGRSYVDPDFIGGVMIEKGPSSAADGADVIGGVVRMNTITADDILLPGKSFGVRLKGGFNSNSSAVPPIDTTGGLHGAGTYPSGSVPTSFSGPDGMDRPSFLDPTGGNGSIAAAYKSDYVDLVAAFARRKNGNYYAGTHGDVPAPLFFPDCGSVADDLSHCLNPQPGRTTVKFEGLNRFRPGEEVLNTSQDNTSVLLKGTLHLPDDQQIDVGYMRYKSDYGEIMPSQLIYSENYGAYQAALNSITMNTYTANYKWNPSENDLINLKAGLWMTDAELTIPSQYFGYADDPTLKNYWGSVNKRYGLNVENTSKFDTAWGGVSLSYGGSLTYETIKPGEDADTAQRRGDRRETSLFTSGEWKPTNWLTLDASLRYSDFKVHDKQWTYDHQVIFQSPQGNYYQTVNVPDPDNYKSYEGSGISPIVSAIVEPWDGIQFYGKYGEAKRLPSLFEMTRGFSTGFVLPGLGAGLKPEDAKTWEFGINVLRDDVFLGGDHLRFKASYFDNHVDDYITRIAAGPDAPIVNIDYAELRGIELSGSYDMGRFFGDLAYTHYTNTNFCTKPGQIIVSNPLFSDLCYGGGVVNSYILNQIPPKDSLSLTLGVRAFDDKLTVGTRVTYIGKRPVSGLAVGLTGSGGTIPFIKWNPYTLVDLFASYKVNDNFQIDAAIDNVTDQYYMDALTLGLMASPGRTFRLNMTARF
jgi:hemoglobin/transferrin/lactoferrin receptor protein